MWVVTRGVSEPCFQVVSDPILSVLVSFLKLQREVMCSNGLTTALSCTLIWCYFGVLMDTKLIPCICSFIHSFNLSIHSLIHSIFIEPEIGLAQGENYEKTNKEPSPLELAVQRPTWPEWAHEYAESCEPRWLSWSKDAWFPEGL